MSIKNKNAPQQPQRRKLIKGATALAGLASLGFPYLSLAQNKPIRVGMPTILSGRVAMLGQASTNAAQMEVEKFIKAREWCTATWGPAVEYQWFDPYGEENGYTHWCFDTRQVKNSSKFKPAIYLQTDAELTLFQLRWC